MATPISSSSSTSSTSGVNSATASLQANQQLIQQLLNNSSQPSISFGGLVSGLNTQAIVQALMSQAQIPVVELQNEQAMEQAKLQAWQDLNTKITSLQQAADTLGLSATIGAKTVSLAGPSGTFATATANTDAANGNFQLEIDSLATATQVVSTAGIGAPITSGDVATFNTKLPTPVTTGTFTVNGIGITVTAGETFGSSSANTGILGAIKAATGGAVTGEVVNNTIQLTSASNIQLGSAGDTSNFLSVTKLLGEPAATTMTSAGPIGEANSTTPMDSGGNINGLLSKNNGSLVINGVTINYNTAVDSLQDVLNRINASAAGVTATYDPNTDTTTFVSSKTGNLDVSMADGNGNLLASLNVATPASHQLGTSASYKVNNGPTQYSLSNTVSNLRPGVNVTLQATTPAGQPLQGTVALDSSVGEGALNTFVTAYNAVVDLIAQDTAYDPTTKQAGIFLGDPAIDTIRQQLDSNLFISNGVQQGLTNGFTEGSVIGLNTGAVGSTPGTTTHLQFDQTALESALAQNPAAVTKLVTTVFSNFSKLTLNLTQPFGVIDSAIQSETNQIIDFQHSINDQNQLLQQQQTILNQEFTSLETTLAKLQSQSGSGSSALAALNSSGSSTGNSGATSGTGTTG